MSKAKMPPPAKIEIPELRKVNANEFKGGVPKMQNPPSPPPPPKKK